MPININGMKKPNALFMRSLFSAAERGAGCGPHMMKMRLR